MKCLLSVLLVASAIIITRRVVAAASIDCASVYNHLSLDSSHTNSTQDELCTSPSCCQKSHIPSLVNSSATSWFNNTLKYTQFKTKLTSHVDFMRSNPITNSSLWNATVTGLEVLREWGVRYWDGQYLTHNLISPECAAKVVQGAYCGLCVTKSPSTKPCKSLCHNIVIGCVKTPLADYVEGPWKHAVNSVRTAVRLISTEDKHKDLINDLNVWREPITWWTNDNPQSYCESLPETNCWNGESVGTYDSAIAHWRTGVGNGFNPEFTRSSGSSSSVSVSPSVIVALDQFRAELVAVRKSLEKYWPTTGGGLVGTPVTSRISHHPPHALPLSSEELHEGSGNYYDEEEEMEYGSTGGYGPRTIDSDDEDLNPSEGSGSGEADDNVASAKTPTESYGLGDSNISGSGPPVSLNGSVSCTRCVVFTSFWFGLFLLLLAR